MSMPSTVTVSGAERAVLLERHQPHLLYDALEAYFADAADEWTLNSANALHRRDGTDVTPADGLSLAYLGPTYPDGVPAGEDDYIACTDRHYDAQYVALRSANP